MHQGVVKWQEQVFYSTQLGKKCSTPADNLKDLDVIAAYWCSTADDGSYCFVSRNLLEFCLDDEMQRNLGAAWCLLVMLLLRYAQRIHRAYAMSHMTIWCIMQCKRDIHLESRIVSSKGPLYIR